MMYFIVDEVTFYILVSLAVGSTILLFILLVLFPKQAWRLVKARFGKRALAIVHEESGIADICLVDRASDNIGEVDYKGEKIPMLIDTANKTTPPNFILQGVKKPIFIAYLKKGVLENAKQLLVLDPQKIDNAYYGLFSSALFSYKQFVKARAYKELSRIPWKAIIVLTPLVLAMFIGATILLSVLGG